jgi:hypothetical protein
MSFAQNGGHARVILDANPGMSRTAVFQRPEMGLKHRK